MVDSFSGSNTGSVDLLCLETGSQTTVAKICSENNQTDTEGKMRNQNKDKRFMCSECYKSFQYKSGLKHHMHSRADGQPFL